MVDLPSVGRRIVTTQSADVSPQAAAAPFQILAKTLDDMGETFQTAGVPLQQEAGARSVTRDAEGNIQASLRPEFSRADAAYNRGVQMGAMAEYSNQMRTGLGDLRRKHENDPQGFEKAATDYVNVLSSRAPGALGPSVRAQAQSLATQFGEGLQNQKQASDLKLAQERIQSEATRLDDEMAALARQGGVATPEYQARQADMARLIEEQVANPKFAMPREKADLALAQAASRHKGEVLVGMVEREIETKGLGAAAALSATLSKQVDDPKLALSPAERQRYQNAMRSSISQGSAEQRAIRTELREETKDFFARIQDRAEIDPREVTALTERATQAGDPLLAARIQRAAVWNPFLDRFKKAPLDEAVGMLGGDGQPAGRATGFEARLVTRESGGRAGVVNGLGYAGLYQFGAPRLATLGLYKPDGSLQGWSKTAGKGEKWGGEFQIPGHPEVKTLQDFLQSPEAQRTAFAAHRAEIDQQIATKGLDQYIGQTVGGVLITREGIHAMAHLGGIGGAERALKGGGNAKDANGTSVLDYARMGMGGNEASIMFRSGPVDPGALREPSGPAGMPLQTWQAVQTEIAQKARTTFTSIESGLEKGLPPSRDELDDLASAVRMSGDDDLAQRVADRLQNFEKGRMLSALAPEEQSTYVAGLRASAMDGAAANERDFVMQAEAIVKRRQEVFKDSPIQAAEDAQIVRPSPGLNFRDPNGMAGALKLRAAQAAMADAQWRTGPVSILKPGEADAFGGLMATGAPQEQAAALGALASTLPPPVYRATMADLFKKSEDKIAAIAGAKWQDDPKTAESILRGRALLAQEPKYKPEPTKLHDLLLGDRSAGDGEFPISVLPDAMRGQWSVMVDAATAVYADNLARRGVLPADLDNDAMTSAITAVTGGVLDYNGGKIIAPRKGMAQADLDEVTARVTDADLDGAVTLSGRGLTAGDFRRSARLQSYADGRYLLYFGETDAPQYIMRDQGVAGGDRLQPFILDLRGR